MKSPEIFAVAGEESANQYLKQILREFKDSSYKFSGVSFTSLSAEGFNVLYDSKQLAVMGVVELVSKAFKISKLFKLCLEYIEKNRPQALLLIDYGGFNLRLAEKVKKQFPEIKILYFISPKLWAWNHKRVFKVKKYVDHMYVIHPFEVDFYKKWGVDAEFVGHPLSLEYKAEYADPEWMRQSRLFHGLDPDKKQLFILLGSREGEISKHLVPFGNTALSLLEKNSNLQLSFLIPPSFSKEVFIGRLRAQLGEVAFKVLQSSHPMEVMALADVALVASGTATLQMGIVEKPMAIAYKMNPLTVFILKRLIHNLKYVGLVNILLEKEVSKEFLQENCKKEKLEPYLQSLINEEELYLSQKEELHKLREELGSLDTYSVLREKIENVLA